MIWLGVLLCGLAITDLVHSIRPLKILPEVIGASLTISAAVWIGLQHHVQGWLLWGLGITAVMIAWGQSVTWAFGKVKRSHARAWVPLAIGGAAVAFVALCAPRSAIPHQAQVLVVGAFLIQLSTGNVVVRLVLAATRTVNPSVTGALDDDEVQLKGGRLLGPMERVFILGLGLVGQVTAAAIVVAAKGLLRFPELSAKRDQERIHQMTEYFLVGSFLSWLFALSTLALVTVGWDVR